MSNSIRISSVQFSQFKAFRSYSLSLDRLNILVGPNNSGKSTIIGAFRALAAGLRIARSAKPAYHRIGQRQFYGYWIGGDALPISLENVSTDYQAGETKVIFNVTNRRRIELLFQANSGCFLVPEVVNETVTTTAAFKRFFPIDLVVVPVLGPLEPREQIVERDTVIRGLATHRASRHFRNYWHYFPDGFSDFALLVSTTWPGLTISAPERTDIMSPVLSMFCQEDRVTRELYWSGFGFQVWCQLLTHLSRASHSTVVIIDEPETYLHPDVQRQLIGILRELGPDALIATHSTEIMAEAEPADIILVDKKASSAARLQDVAGVQHALDVVGSIQNLSLTALARNRRVLFVEGDDFRLMRRFSRRLGLVELSAGAGITALESGGFGSWERVTTLAKGIEEALGVPIMIGAVYDHDYHSDEEIAHVLGILSQSLRVARIHQRKELENYLLVPAVLDRAISREANDRATRRGEDPRSAPPTAQLLMEITEPLRDDVQAQIIAHRTNFLRRSGRDVADITRETLTRFQGIWGAIDTRLHIVPGKIVLAQLRERVRSECGVVLTDARIVDAFRPDEIPRDFADLLSDIDRFRASKPQ